MRNTDENRRPSGLFALGALAGVVLLAAAGTGVAQSGLFDGDDIRDRSIPAGKLARGSVGTFEIRSSSIQSQDIQSGAVTVSKLRTSSVTGAKIAPGAVGTTDIASGAITRDKIAAPARMPSVVVRRSAVVTIAAGAIGEAKASCAAGEVLIAGGGGPIGNASDVNLSGSRPEPASEGSVPTRWQVIVENKAVGRTLDIAAEAVCARP